MGEGGVREEATGISRWTMMVVGSGVGSLLCRLFSFHRIFLSFFLLSSIHLLPTSRLVWAKNMFFENHEHQRNRIFQVYTSISYSMNLFHCNGCTRKWIFDKIWKIDFYLLFLLHFLPWVLSHSHLLSSVYLLSWSTPLFIRSNILLNLDYSVLCHRINLNKFRLKRKFWLRRQYYN